MKKISFSVSLLALSFYSAFGQVNVPGNFFEPIEQDFDSIGLSLFTSVSDEDYPERFKLIDPLVKLSFNSAYPRGFNDGAIWKGKGLTTEAHAGFGGTIGAFSYTFFPTVYLSQNSDFKRPPHTNPYSEYSYQFGNNRIDWVQQYGSGSFTRFHFGQSELKFKKGRFRAAISTQNYSQGPSLHNPIILSRQAGGFPHIRLGAQPFDLKLGKARIGKFDINLLAGLLKESEYFDTNTSNDDRYFNSLFVGYSPSFLPALTVGFYKALYKSTEFFEAADLRSVLIVTETDPTLPNDSFDQLASISMNWNFPEVGFRTYAEFAKNDFTSSGEIRGFLVEPEHSRAFTIGFEKTGLLGKKNRYAILYEHTTLSRNHTFLWRPEPTFYAHDINRQGYTNEGQILGAGIGPGGNSDNMSISLDFGNRKAGGQIQRIEKNKDYFVVNIQNANLHDVEYTGGLFYQQEKAKMIWTAETNFSYNYNRDYVRTDNVFNFYMGLSSRFKL